MQIPFYIPIAFKNIFRDPRRSFTLGISYFFIALLLVLVFSSTQGMKKNIADTVIASTAGHITVTGENIVNGRTYQGIKNFPRITETIKKSFPYANVYSRYALSSLVYYKNLSKRLTFTGIDPAVDAGLRNQITVSNESWNSFVNQYNGVIISQSLASYFGLVVGDELLVAARTRLGAFNTGTVQVKGIYTTGNYFLRDLVLSRFDFLQKLDLADTITASKMFVFFENIRGSEIKRDLLIPKLTESGFVAIKPASKNDALNAVSAASPRYKVEDENLNQIRLTLSTADEVTGIVSQAVAAINAIGLFIAAIMLFIISVSIFINMRMTINDRMLEIGTLRAMGSSQGDIVALFIFENVFLSTVFISLGIAVAIISGALFSTFVTLPANGVLGLFLNNGHFVLAPTFTSILCIVGILLFFTALFSYFPARYGGKIPPVVALNKV